MKKGSNPMPPKGVVKPPPPPPPPLPFIAVCYFFFGRQGKYKIPHGAEVRLIKCWLGGSALSSITASK